MRAPPNDAWKAMANANNRAILARLARGPSYPRALAGALGLTEGDVQRKLQRLARAGLVAGAWRHRGKTVKEYALCADSIVLEISGDDVRLSLAVGEGSSWTSAR